MPIYSLDSQSLWFPGPEEYEDDVIAVDGDLRPERLVAAYSQGIFPWYNHPGDIIWWNPQMRCVLFFDKLRVSHSMRNVMNKKIFHCTFDRNFREVMEGCREGSREGETWIHDEVIDAYCRLHEIGLAHSVEVWSGTDLVGGLYGVSLGRMFCGESMFSRASNSSKFALIYLVSKLRNLGFQWIDCQVMNDHLHSLGATEVPRMEYLGMLQNALKQPTIKGKWFERSDFFE